MLNSFHSCISNTSKKFSRTPKMSFRKISPQPRMFPHQIEGTISFKQLKGSANTHSWRKLNKQMDMINSNVEFINFTPVFNSHFADESFTIHPQPIKLKWVHRIFNFPDKMESILSEGMFPTFQIHFLTPQTLARNTVHTKLVNLFKEGNVNPLYFKELNINKENGSPPKLKSKGIRAVKM